jgi:predicted acetyltransferase
MTIQIVRMGQDRLADVLGPIGAAFGMAPDPARLAEIAKMPELDVRIAAVDGGKVVAGMGSFTFELTVPGALVEVAGLTIVGVLPTHRRQGLLRRMLREYLDGVRARGQAVSALFASEGPIYPRFGYGLASEVMEIDVERDRSAFVSSRDEHVVGSRLLSAAEALPAFAAIWDRARLSTPGMLSRSPEWWQARRIVDHEWLRRGRGPLERVLLTLDGVPSAYALYRITSTFEQSLPTGSLEVLEAVGDSPAAIRAIWRWLFDVDAIRSIKAKHLSPHHPLLFLMAEPSRLQARTMQGLWIRLVDAPAALRARRYASDGAITLELVDPFCPWNDGRYRVEVRGGEAAVERTTAPADLKLDAPALGAIYLGGFSVDHLIEAGRIEAMNLEAAALATPMFRSTRAPWVVEQF